jgi:23S rRNA (uracil1939-C5)-methyltransferase
MLTAGQMLMVTVEKPAVGGRMIAYVDRQVVLVDGAIPGERVSVRIVRVGKGVAYAETLAVEERSPDRRDVLLDRACGGCLYAHIAYPRQLEIKSLVIADAFVRTAHLPLATAVSIHSSPPEGYRMRARLHRRGGRLGFFREGTHDLCDPRSTGQLLPATYDILDHLAAALAGQPAEATREVDLSESIDGSQRVIHLHPAAGCNGPSALPSMHMSEITGLTTVGSTPGAVRVLSGSAYVSDLLDLDVTFTLRRHVLAFFQGNRFLLRELVSHVMDQVPLRSTLIDLYAGGGLFSIAIACVRDADVIAVEGDPVAAADLEVNAKPFASIRAFHEPIERFVQGSLPQPDVVIVDPPRTGISREALQGIAHLRGRRLVYVSCDVATLARDARRLVDAGYWITTVSGFDLFPNTPHVETVVVFDRS